MPRAGENFTWEQLRPYPISKATLYLVELSKGVVTCRDAILVTEFSTKAGPEKSRITGPPKARS